MVHSSGLHLLHRFSISDDIWRAWVSFLLTDFFSFSNFKYSSYFILTDWKPFIIDESMVIVYGFRLFATIWSLIIHLEIIILGDMLTWIRLLLWLKPLAWTWLSVKTKASTDASFLNLEKPRVSKYSLSKCSSFGNSIDFSLNFMTLPSRNSLKSDIASSQHFVDRMFKFKECVRNNFLSVKNCWSWATAQKLRMQKRKRWEKIRTQRAFFNQFGNHGNNKLLTFLFEFSYLGF